MAVQNTTTQGLTAQMHLYILASGSKGNAAVVEGPNGSVLVDCGLSRRELHRRADTIGCDLDRVCAILITHEHGDHVRGLPVIAKHFDGPIYTTAGTAQARGLELETIAHDATLSLGGMRVQAFPLSHDVSDPACFRFDLLDGTRSVDAVGWATDTGVLTSAAQRILHDCRILGIEANHDPDLLATGPYPYYLKRRVGGSHGHLSNTQAAEALPNLVTRRTQTVVAMHISQKNNTESCVRTALRSALDEIDEQVELVLARQDEPVLVW